MGSPWRRRLITVTTVVLIFSGLSLGAPLWIPLTLLVGLFRRRRWVLARLLTFGLVYATMELAGLVRIAGAWRTHRRDRHALQEAVYEIQAWWAGTLYRSMFRIMSLDVQVEGAEALTGGPFILLMRHTSIMDTLLPAALVADGMGVRLRYVLKRELLLDPCLDIAGHILPNHFVDRSQPSGTELVTLKGLAQGLDPGEAVVIYPEGTRFSPAKRTQILSRLQARGSRHLAQAAALQRTLPPRAGGVGALLDGAPQTDVVVCAHEGLDGFATLADLLRGRIVGQTIQVAFWRLPATTIPATAEERADWLFRVWSEVDQRARLAIRRSSPGA